MVEMNKTGLVVLLALAIFAISGLVWGLTGPHNKQAAAPTTAGAAGSPDAGHQ
jgi:hypothetical protein